MKYSLRFLIILFILIFSHSDVMTLEVVYPAKNNHKTSAPSIFFVGNVKKGSELFINNEPVKIWEHNSFVHVVPLNKGENTFTLKEKINNKEQSTLKYVVTRTGKTNNAKKPAAVPVLTCYDPVTYHYGLVVTDNTPFRQQPDENAKRLTHLDSGTMIRITGEKGGYYQVSFCSDERGWVKKNSVIDYRVLKTPVFSAISDIKVDEDKYFNYIKIDLDMQMPYKIQEIENGLVFKIYGIQKNYADRKILNNFGNIKNIAINTSSDNTATLFIDLKNKILWGYSCGYEGNMLVLKIRKEPRVNKNKPLKGLTIALDAGHGGKDRGAAGPTNIKESDINLDITLKLKKELEKSGAKVILTRKDDSYVSLSDRIERSREKNALFFISVHANALPDGANPYKKHGTSVFYYHDGVFSLADTIKKQMLKDLATRDDGTNKASFAVIRPSMPLSVLIETAYMINPEDYSRLLDEKFRIKTAESIRKALETYVFENASIK